jgi:hypothetical protein
MMTNNEYLSLIIFLLLHLISLISPFLNHQLLGFEPNTKDIISIRYTSIVIKN